LVVKTFLIYAKEKLCYVLDELGCAVLLTQFIWTAAVAVCVVLQKI